MIGVFSSASKSMEDPKKEPLQLSDNFYVAITQAEREIGGKAIIVNSRTPFAIVAKENSDLRILISRY